MKAKHRFVAIAALLAGGGLWLAQSSWRAQHFANHKPAVGAHSKTPPAGPKAGQMLNSPARLAPPDPIRKFWELTPEQRVERARHPVGG